YFEIAEPGPADRRPGSRGPRWVVAVEAAAEDGDRRPSRLERAPVGLAVDAAREAADDDDAGRRELQPDQPRDLFAVSGARARTDDGHCRPREQLRIWAS